ncbi:hypothetical protein G9A89_023425 [Geosiphon pyriformis]|nr:hypothetical protein G9A89_023425 [Geosiphon pyriformis]
MSPNNSICPKCENLLPINQPVCPPCDFPIHQSGIPQIDNLLQEIQRKLLKKRNGRWFQWIPFEKLQKIQFITQGVRNWECGEKIILFYSNESKNNGEIQKMVSLKEIFNSSKIGDAILNEIEKSACLSGNAIIPCFGLSQNPITRNFILVMPCMTDKTMNDYAWKLPSFMLFKIIDGLKSVHGEGLVHCDLHPGNIMLSATNWAWITGFAQCRTEKERNKSKDVFGIIPYIAPEVLQGKPFTQASDIYSFGILVWEACSIQRYLCHKKHDANLIQEICNGLRPKIQENIPKFFSNIMQQCWAADPRKRPTAEHLKNLFSEILDKNHPEHRDVYEFQPKEPENSKAPHRQAFYKSRTLNSLIKTIQVKPNHPLPNVNISSSTKAKEINIKRNT